MNENQCTLCFKEEQKLQDIKYTGLVNLVADYAIENKMSASEIDKCIDRVKNVFYENALVKR